MSQVLTRDDDSVWPKLSPAAKETVKAELLNSLREEQERSITKKVGRAQQVMRLLGYEKVSAQSQESHNPECAHLPALLQVCDCVAELGAGIIEDNGWPDLLPFIFQCVQSGQERLLEAAFLVFEQLARYVMEVLTNYLGTLHTALAGGLNHASLDVKLAALKATIAFISGLENPNDRDQFQPMVPLLLAAVGQALNAGDEVTAQEAVERLIEIAEEHPRFLRKQLPDVASAMLQIAETDALDEGTRRLAAEFLVTLCEAREKAPGMMRKLPQFVHRLFGCCLSFLMDIEDDPAWHTAEDEKMENEGEGELFEFGQECLDRLALALGGKTMVPVAGAAFPEMMASSDWKRRHAALVCLAQIAEGCVRVMSEEAVMTQLVAMCMQGAADPHAKVRWAACQAVGQLCTDLGPDLQESQHATVLPVLMGLMDDFNTPRVQAHACAATVNFAENADQDVMAPYLDTLISKLLALLQQGRRNVQEGALTSLASVADCAQEYFIKYYDTCMPLLRHVLEHAQDKTHQLMRAKALECISLVGMAVGKERFGADAAGVMQYMQAVQAAGLDPDDPFASYMLQAGARICTTLGADFIPYLPVVMPPMLEAARLQPDIVVRENGAEGDEDGTSSVGDDDEDVETFMVGGKRVSLHTSILEEKANACSMLCCYAYELKEGFFPYAEEVTQIMVPLLKFYFNEEVRSAAAQAIPELLRSAVEAAKKGMGPDEAFCRNMAAFAWPPMVDALAKEIEPEVVHTFLVSIEEVVDVLNGPALLPLDQMAPVFASFNTVLADYEERRASRMERAEGEDFDAEEQEALEEEHEAEGELLDALGTCCTTILRLYGDAAMPLVEALMPAVGKLLEKGRYVEERRVALCLMDDIIQYSPVGAAKYMPQVLPMLLEGAADRDPNIRQCCVYGLGQAAQHRTDGLRPHAPPAVSTLTALIQAPDARSDVNATATENAVSALAKFVEFLPDCVDPSAGTLVLQNLPLEEDETEAKVVHGQLLRLVLASDPRILGANNANLPKIVEVMVRVLAKGEKLVSAEDAQGMVELLKKMQGMLPAEMFNGFVASLKPKQQATLQAVLEGKHAKTLALA